MQSTSESDEPIHIINVGIKFSKKEKFDDNTLGIKFQDFCKERVSNRNLMTASYTFYWSNMYKFKTNIEKISVSGIYIIF